MSKPQLRSAAAAALDPSQQNKKNGAPTSVTRIGQGIVSCLQIPELHQFAGRLQSVCLHGNSIGRIEGLDKLTALRELNLSSNNISQLENISQLSNLTSLNLASNKLTGALGSLAGLANLAHLNVSYNALTSLAGIGELQGPDSKLKVVNAKNNALASLQVCAVLAGCVSLRDLSISGNPISQLPNYRQAILSVLPHITQLDNLSGDDTSFMKFDVVAAQNIAAAKLQAFQPVQVLGSNQSYASTYQQMIPGSQAQGSDTQITPKSQRPAEALHGQSLYMKQPHSAQQSQTAMHQQTIMHNPEHRSHSPAEQVRPGFVNSRTPGHYAQHHTTSTYSSQQPLPSPVDTRSRHHNDQQPTIRQQQHPSESSPPDQNRKYPGSHSTNSQAIHQQEMQRVYLKDASVQAGNAAEMDKSTMGLKAELKALKKQLTELTEELEGRNQSEEELRQQMAAALQAMEEESHRRVEEGYREASQAVKKALSELEHSRRQAAELQLKCEALSRKEDETRQQLASLNIELTRFREENNRLREVHQSDMSKVNQSLDTERRRNHEAEMQLRAQHQATEDKLAAQLKDAAEKLASSRAAAAAAEQKVAALEAALEQSNTVAVNMTQKIAQSMADSSTQMDALKSKLSSTEQQLSDVTRREAELKVEVSMLTTNITTLQQRHAQELEAVKKQAAEELATRLSRDVAVAEERGRSAAMMSVQQDKSGLQEQLAFLKAQLQFALKESDRETSGLQNQLSRAQEQMTELQAAASASAAKQREHESLVNDLSSVVGQQKMHIQALQKERDNLASQLRAAGPEHLQRLAAEAATLRGAAAEAGVLRGQIEHARRQWQDTERKLAEAQASSARHCEELQQKVNNLESSLAASKQETQAALDKAKDLASQIESARDALKVKTAMIDSANDTIATLKSELSEIQVEVEEARRQVEEVEVAAARQAEADAQEKANLRAEIEAGEAALEAMNSSVSGADGKVSAAEARAREAESKVKALDKQLAEKDELIKYVEEEVNRVKGLYEKREARLREERDAARSAAETATASLEKWEARASEQAARLDKQAADLQIEREACRAAQDAYARAQSEAEQLAARLSETETELRTLLAAVEKQKVSSAVKMRQLATLLSEMG